MQTPSLPLQPSDQHPAFKYGIHGQTMNIEALIQATLRETGGILRYQYQPWDMKYVLENERGERMELTNELMHLDEWHCIRKIIAFITKDVPLALEADTTANGKRLRKINDELDILRGVKPTPSGYKVDICRVKILTMELKNLTAEKNNV